MESGAKFYFEEILRPTELGVSRKFWPFCCCFVGELQLPTSLTISAVVFDFRCHQFDQLLTSYRVDHGLGRRLDK